jgi:hypothetical protein
MGQCFQESSVAVLSGGGFRLFFYFAVLSRSHHNMYCAIATPAEAKNTALYPISTPTILFFIELTGSKKQSNKQ